MDKSRQSERYLMNRFGRSWMSADSVIAFLPIKPVYANRILDGSKRYEFRRSRLRQDITHVVIYSTSQVSKIVGIAEVAGVKATSVSAAWRQTRQGAGISRSPFNAYFSGAQSAVFISLRRVVRLKKELDSIEVRSGFKIPQSFSYVDESFIKRVLFSGVSNACEA
jgi:predicted transcriptional regulator